MTEIWQRITMLLPLYYSIKTALLRALILLSICGFAPNTSASIVPVPIFWGGSGAAAGIDPLGHQWRFFQNSFQINVGAFGDGWLGSYAIRDFHIHFLGQTILRPETVFITGGPSAAENQIWDREFTSADTLSFYAPPGTALNPGQMWFLTINLDPATSTSFAFEAEYSVPEPSTLLLSFLAIACGWRIRKK